MAQMTMYSAINNSPKTAVSANMTASDTSIQVERADALPKPPNLATLGEDENAEVISYSGKDGNTLTGVVRGVNGTTASPWPVGTAVYRAYTAYDHDAFKANIEDLEARKASSVNGALPDSEGNIQLDASQIAETEERVFVSPGQRQKLGRLSGENILVNGYLASPINQRGQTSYQDTSGTGALCIDHWWITNHTIASPETSPEKGELYLNYPADTAGMYIFLQKIEKFAAFRGKTLTFSMLFKNLTGSVNLQVQFQPDYSGQAYSASITAPGLASVTFTVPEDAQMLWVCLVATEIVPFYVKAVAAKLELGEEQTLARQEGASWTLLDPPPDPALELAKCQRYYERVAFQPGERVYVMGVREQNNYFGVTQRFGAQKRVAPTVTLQMDAEGTQGLYYRYPGQAASISAKSDLRVGGITPYGFTLYCANVNSAAQSVVAYMFGYTADAEMY